MHDDAVSRKEEIKREKWDEDSIVKKHPRRKWLTRATVIRAPAFYKSRASNKGIAAGRKERGRQRAALVSFFHVDANRYPSCLLANHPFPFVPRELASA